MRCRGCNGEMAAYKRYVKEGETLIPVDEDLCSDCRSAVFGSKFDGGDDTDYRIHNGFLESLISPNRRLPRGGS